MENGSLLTPKELVERAKLLRANKADPVEIDAAFREAIIANPGDRLALAEWMDIILARDSTDEIADRLTAIQASVETPIRSVLLAIRDLVGMERLHELLGPELARMRADLVMLTIAEAWRAHQEGARLADDTATAILRGPKFSTEVFFAFLAEPIEQRALFDERAPSIAALQRHGIDPEPFRDSIRKLLDLSGEPHARNLERAFAHDAFRLKKAKTAETASVYKYHIIADGNFKILDPYGSGEIYAIDSVRFFGRTIYAFRGRKLFYLICGNMGNDLVGMYVPEDNLAVTFSDKRSSLMSDPNLVSVRVQLLARICRSPDLFHEAFARGGSSTPKRVVFHLEKTENLAHHLWNFYSSLDHVVTLGLTDRISRVIFAGTEFFGPLDDFFPEIKAIGVERPGKNHIVDPCPFSADEIMVGAGSMVMFRTLPDRIIKAMEARPPSGCRAPGDADRAAFPIVWLGMRLGDKSWVDQQQELPRIIDAIADRHPNALFLLDGFSVPVGDRAIATQWSSFKDRIATISREVRAACANPDRVIDLVDNTMQESVLWAALTDVYLAPLGTTQHKVAWFTDAPGLTYAPPSFANTAIQTPGAWAAEISPTPVFVFGEAASAGERRGVSRNREKMQNVTLDTPMITQRLLEMIDDIAIGRETAGTEPRRSPKS